MPIDGKLNNAFDGMVNRLMDEGSAGVPNGSDERSIDGNTDAVDFNL